MYRSKRVRYCPRACNECQRRKVKCDGQSPCARCKGQLFDCVYSSLARSGSEPQSRRRKASSSTPRNKPRPIATEENVSVGSSLFVESSPSNSTANGNQDFMQARPGPYISRNSPEFCGPSSIEYTFKAVNGNLLAKGLQSAIPEKNSGPSIPSTSTGRLARYGPFMKLLTADPLWDMTHNDALALIDDWFHGLGALYPIVNRQKMIATANTVFASLQAAHSGGLRERGGAVAEALFDHDTNKLKLVLAIGIALENSGQKHQARRLFQSTSEVVEGLIWDPEGIHGIQLLFLVAMYHLCFNEEVRTGRCTAFAARLCLETGLHRRTMLDKTFSNSAERDEALNAFWAVYMFERRLSLGQGIPFSIQESHIDKALYSIASTTPLQSALLQWTTLAGTIWHALNNQAEKSYGLRVDDINDLDHQILEWYHSLPADLQLADNAVDTANTSPQPSYPQSVLFVRKAHLRNLIYRPILYTSEQTSQSEVLFLKAIEISKETIRTVSHLYEHTQLVYKNTMFFQQLLLTAFGNLLLAFVNTGPRLRNSVREEFDMFLHVFQRLSSECTALNRTWQRLQGLRDLHARMNQSDRGAHVAEQHNENDAEGKLASTLSFDDIFPNISDLWPGIGTDSAFDFSAEDVGGMSDLSILPEDFTVPETFYSFPFLHFNSYV